MLQDEIQYEGEYGKILDHLLESAFCGAIDGEKQEFPGKITRTTFGRGGK